MCLKTGFDEHSKCWHVNEAFEPLQKEQAECLINAGPPTRATGSGIRDKHSPARGHRQHQLSPRQWLSDQNNDCACPALSLRWQLRLPAPIILINPVIFPKPALYRPLMRNLIRSRQKRQCELEPTSYLSPLAVFLHFKERAIWPGINARATAAVTRLSIGNAFNVFSGTSFDLLAVVYR